MIGLGQSAMIDIFPSMEGSVCNPQHREKMSMARIVGPRKNRTKECSSALESAPPCVDTE